MSAIRFVFVSTKTTHADSTAAATDAEAEGRNRKPYAEEGPSEEEEAVTTDTDGASTAIDLASDAAGEDSRVGVGADDAVSSAAEGDEDRAVAVGMEIAVDDDDDVDDDSAGAESNARPGAMMTNDNDDSTALEPETNDGESSTESGINAYEARPSEHQMGKEETFVGRDAFSLGDENETEWVEEGDPPANSEGVREAPALPDESGSTDLFDDSLANVLRSAAADAAIASSGTVADADADTQMSLEADTVADAAAELATNIYAPSERTIGGDGSPPVDEDESEEDDDHPAKPAAVHEPPTSSEETDEATIDAAPTFESNLDASVVDRDVPPLFLTRRLGLYDIIIFVMEDIHIYLLTIRYNKIVCLIYVLVITLPFLNIFK